MTEKNVEQSQLGQQTSYPTQYDPNLLLGIPRQPQRMKLDLPEHLPFYGKDVWSAYELSWLTPSGKPNVAMAQFYFDALSPCLIESKSLKLYLNSFNMSTWPNQEAVYAQITQDLSQVSQKPVDVMIHDLRTLDQTRLIGELPGLLLDDLDVLCNEYTINSNLLTTEQGFANETLSTQLLKSNCLVTGQPDWGSMTIRYAGQKINHENLLRYLISYRNHLEFHEQCVERCFWDIWRLCKPKELTIIAQYTRRGGLDITPIRSSNANFDDHSLQRTVRQ